MITKLNPNEIFVFGSNLAGNHAGGAAKQAKEQFGAEEGIGEGLTGRCYAFPTLNADFSKRSERQLCDSARKLSNCANDNPNKVFLLTKVGCGIAGFSEDYMKSLFTGMPNNVVKPKEWL